MLAERPEQVTEVPMISAEDFKLLRLVLPKREHFSCRITAKSKFKEICGLIKEKLSKRELERFRETQFGHLLDMPDHYQHSSQLMWFFILRQIETKKDEESLNKAKENNRLRDKYFGGKNSISVNDLYEKLEAMSSREDNKLKITLLLFLYGVLRAQDYRRPIDISHMAIVDDVDLFDNCDWGVQTYEYTLKSLRKNIRDIADNMKENGNAPGMKQNYTFYDMGVQDGTRRCKQVCKATGGKHASMNASLGDADME
ncbi:hypothetical protein TIFTF001_033013 [Ficus carica]|uniref:DUF1985 domain-containing protein n=1 Tax=Ficus carica TaxID=3494 RepID=A0AA88DY60_FICCA|nr:hypothetical protein TIFTF001_033013 [Ficus carica]